MKTKFKTLFIGLLISSSFFSQNIPGYIPNSGLVGYWGFDGNASDASSNTNNGIVHNATLSTDRYGNQNSAYQFIGNDNNTVSYIATGYTNLPSGTTPRTISVWVSHDTYGVPGGQGNDGHPILGYGKPETNSDNELFFATTNGGNPFILYGGFQNDLTVDFSYTTNTWYHIVVTFDGTTAKLYSNNSLIGSADKSSWNTKLDSLFIGSQPNKMRYHNGKIDELGIWNRVLTTNEINNLFIGCSNPTAEITPSSSTTFCEGESVTLNATAGSNFNYEWYKNNSLIPNESSSSLIASQTGDYSVKIIDGACNTISSTTSITVNPIPTVILNTVPNLFSSDNDFTLSASPAGGVFSGNGVTGSIFSPSISGLGRKLINYTYTSPQGCEGSNTKSFIVSDTVGNICSTYDTLKITVNFTTGIHANKSNIISVYPNPTNELINVQNSDFSIMTDYSIVITNIMNQEVYNQKITSSSSQINLNVLGAKGLYILNIVDPNNSSIANKKIILE